MARFARSFALLLFLLILTSAGLYGVSENVAPVYPEVWKPIKILEGKEEQVEVITLRNSHNRAIHFDAMGMEGFHLWRGGGDIFEAKYVLRNVYPDLDSLQYVLIPFQGFVFDNSTSDYRSEKRREWYSLEKFGLDYLKGDAILFVRGRLVDPIIRPDHWRGIFYPFFSFLLRSKEVKQNGWVGPRSTDHIAPESIPEQAARRAQKHIDIHRKSISKNKDLCKDAISSIKDMSNKIEKNSLVVIYKPPYTKEYTEEIESKSLCSRLEERAKMLSKNNDNLVFLDLSEVIGKNKSYKYFRDPDHLNLHGAQVLSSALADSLKNISRMK